MDKKLDIENALSDIFNKKVQWLDKHRRKDPQRVFDYSVIQDELDAVRYTIDGVRQFHQDELDMITDGLKYIRTQPEYNADLDDYYFQTMLEQTNTKTIKLLTILYAHGGAVSHRCAMRDLGTMTNVN